MVKLLEIICVFFVMKTCRAAFVCSDFENQQNDHRGLMVKRQLPAPSVAYYDFLVNEFSYKVWAVFQVLTIALLFYSTIAAIYYAKWLYLRTTPTDDDISLLRRSREEAEARFMRSVVMRRQIPEPTLLFYNFGNQELSFKFWAFFEVWTLILLFYSLFAGWWYAWWYYLRTAGTEDDDNDGVGNSRRSLSSDLNRVERIVRSTANWGGGRLVMVLRDKYEGGKEREMRTRKRNNNV